MIEGIIVGIILAFWPLVIYGIFEGHKLGRGNLQDEAVQKGFAQHNPKTGEWEWKS